MRQLAALIHFGLLEETGGGATRRVRLTILAKAILLDRRENTTERDAALRKAALNPTIYATLWKEWGPALPSEASMEYELVTKYKFNPDSVRAFIKDFRASVIMAKLGQSTDVRDAPEDRQTDDGQTVTPVTRQTPLIPKSPPPSHGGGEPMPQVQPDMPGNLAPFDITILLSGGRRAVLRMPVGISQDDFDRILRVMPSQLEENKPVLVVAPPTNPPRLGEIGESD